jgi:glycosyltransferase involved in cell wall biosynthesis
MRITYLFREKRLGNFSIEELFEAISKKVSLQHQVVNYTCTSANRINNLKEVRKINADVFHITGDVNYLSFVLPARKTLITVHDLGHYENTLKGIKKVIYKYLWLYLPFKFAHKITTISEFTKSRLVYHFNIHPDKIDVIHNPAPVHIFKKSEKRTLSSRPKILQIGSGHNKNIENLIQAVQGLDVELMLLRKHDPLLEQKLHSLHIKHTFYPLLTYQDVYQKYVECDLVYFASNYEGFGVPILEAQAVGRALITSNVAAMPEVAGKGACFVDYQSVAEIKAAIVKLISDSAYRNKLIDNGYENVKHYTLEKTVEKYMAVYSQLQ